MEHCMLFKHFNLEIIFTNHLHCSSGSIVRVQCMYVLYIQEHIIYHVRVYIPVYNFIQSQNVVMFSV